MFRLLTLKRHFEQNIFSPNISFWILVLCCVSWSFNICNFFCSRSQAFGYVGVLKNYVKLTAKHLCWSLILIKPQASYLQSVAFIKEKSPRQVFPCEFCEIFKNNFYVKQLRVTCFCTFNVVKIQFLIYCTLSPKLRYFSNIWPKSINLVSLESHYPVEHHFTLYLKKEKNKIVKKDNEFSQIFLLKGYSLDV